MNRLGLTGEDHLSPLKPREASCLSVRMCIKTAEKGKWSRKQSRGFTPKLDANNLLEGKRCPLASERKQSNVPCQHTVIHTLPQRKPVTNGWVPLNPPHPTPPHPTPPNPLLLAASPLC
ncbi:hypothetical protein Salat_2018000 [Sesamum alatum]|uniref:Uncharacterized protein n=1 Tax=Sesamum alatum TaxID=300844 RepID=A0AAE1XZ01_9LAMI|nr:hypothetical protein Salat_2018000 [Sesamum alatum]